MPTEAVFKVGDSVTVHPEQIQKGGFPVATFGPGPFRIVGVEVDSRRQLAFLERISDGKPVTYDGSESKTLRPFAWSWFVPA